MNTCIRLEAYGDGAADALAQAQERMEELEGLWRRFLLHWIWQKKLAAH